MKPVWHDGDDAPIGSDGKAAIVGHIASRTQAERWQANGYDIAQAVDRYAAFLAVWQTAETEAAADAAVDQFYVDEAEILRKAGIWGDDPDFHRVFDAAKHHEWA